MSKTYKLAPWARILVVGDWGDGMTSTVAAIATLLGRQKSLYRDRTAQIVWEQDNVTWDVFCDFGHGGTVEDRLCVLAQEILGLIIVVDATRGPSQRTEAEALLAKAMKAPKPVVLLNKTDIATPEQVQAAEHQTLRAMEAAGWSQVTILKASATEAWDGNSLALSVFRQLLDTVMASAKAVIESDQSGPLWMPCRLSFREERLLYGRICRGSVAIGDELECLVRGASERRVVEKITAIVRQGEMRGVERAHAGDFVQVAVSGAAFADPSCTPAGAEEWRMPMALVAPGSLRTFKAFSAELHLFGVGQGGFLAPRSTAEEMGISIVGGWMTVVVKPKNGEAFFEPGVIVADVELPFAIPVGVGDGFSIGFSAQSFGGIVVGFGVVARMLV